MLFILEANCCQKMECVGTCASPSLQSSKRSSYSWFLGRLEVVVSINLTCIPDYEFQNVPKLKVPTKQCFSKHLPINNRSVKILIDTGAKISVCGMKQSKLWGILDKSKPSSAKIHPYNSVPIKVRGTALCSVMFYQVHDNQH